MASGPLGRLTAAAPTAAPPNSITQLMPTAEKNHFASTQVSQTPNPYERPSRASTDVSSATQQAVLDRRVDWLKEDLAVIRRRADNTLCAEDAGAGGGMLRLQSCAEQLFSQLAEEREWREHLEGDLTKIETTLQQERSSREKSLGTLSVELEETMKSLVRRIDDGLKESTHELSSRAEKTEAALKNLIVRVEEGLVSGAKDLQDYHTLHSGNSPVGKASLADAAVPVSIKFGQARPELNSSHLDDAIASSSSAVSAAGYPDPLGSCSSCFSGGTSRSAALLSALQAGGAPTQPQAPEAAEPLMKVWSDLQQENMRLQQKRVQLEARQLRSRNRSPMSSHPASPPTAHSRNRSPLARDGLLASTGMNLGTGFRNMGLGTFQEQQATSNSLDLTFGTNSSVKDSDAVSTTSSMPTSASAQNQAQQQQALAEVQEGVVVSTPMQRHSNGLSKTAPSAAGSKVQPGQFRPVLSSAAQRLRPSSPTPQSQLRPSSPVSRSSREIQQGRVVGTAPQPARMGGVGSGNTTPVRDPASMIRQPPGGASAYAQSPLLTRSPPRTLQARPGAPAQTISAGGQSSACYGRVSV